MIEGGEIDLYVNTQVLPNIIGKTNNLIGVLQVGNENHVEISQAYIGQVGNLAGIAQIGNENLGYIDQSGQNLVNLIIQKGNGNISNMWSYGNDILVSSIQTGIENEINSYMDTRSGGSVRASLNQLGNKNIIDVAILGGAKTSPSPNVNISQLGNSHQVTAITDSFSGPINITQTPGIGGSGMEVIISTVSGFKFPLK